MVLGIGAKRLIVGASERSERSDHVTSNIGIGIRGRNEVTDERLVMRRHNTTYGIRRVNEVSEEQEVLASNNIL